MKGWIRIDKAKRIIIAVTAFILMTAGGAMGTVIIDQALSGKEIKPCGLMESIEIISENEKCKQWFIVFELISAVLCTTLVITRNDSYKSKKVKITDRISTPAPMGEGQHGTARFMTEKEKMLLGLLYDANFDKVLINERYTIKDKCVQNMSTF